MKTAGQIVDQLAAPDLRCAFVFADWQHDARVFAREVQRGLATAVVVGGTTTGVIGRAPNGQPAASLRATATGLGFYGDWLRVGVGLAGDVPKAALTRSRDAVNAAAAQLGYTSEQLDPTRHVAITIFDGRMGNEEAFCIGSAAAAPQIRFVGGCAATPPTSTAQPSVWARGEAVGASGIVVVLESALPFHPVASLHLEPMTMRSVVTGADGRRITELDGKPAVSQLTALVGEDISERPADYSFARYVSGTPYVRSITHFENQAIHIACAVEVGQVLRIMRPGDLIGQTVRDLATAGERVGGQIRALLAFSCLGRHQQAMGRGVHDDLARCYATFPVAGMESYGEQSGVLLVNHTLMGLAVGAR